METAMASLKERIRLPHYRLALLLIAIVILIGTAGLVPEGARTTRAATFAPVGPRNDRTVPVVASLNPFVDIVPSTDGTELYIHANGLGQLNDTLFANLSNVPTGHKGGYTMVYSDTLQGYAANIAGFTPSIGGSGTLSITTTQGLSTGSVDFQREYITEPHQTLGSADGRVLLNLVNAGTLPVGVYVVLVASYAPPGAAPAGYRLASQAYSIRASGALAATDKPMAMQWYYDPLALDGASPETLKLFAWDAYQQRWIVIGGQLSFDQSYLSAAVTEFTAYALMTPVTQHAVYLPLVVR